MKWRASKLLIRGNLCTIQDGLFEEIKRKRAYWRKKRVHIFLTINYHLNFKVACLKLCVYLHFEIIIKFWVSSMAKLHTFYLWSFTWSPYLVGIKINFLVNFNKKLWNIWLKSCGTYKIWSYNWLSVLI